MTTCVLFREKKKEDIRQRGRRGRRATDAPNRRGTNGGRGSGRRKRTGYLSNLSLTWPFAHSQGHSAGPLMLVLPVRTTQSIPVVSTVRLSGKVNIQDYFIFSLSPA